MTKSMQLVLVLALAIFSFIAGVRYSDSVKTHASWLFEGKQDEVELPDLSHEGAGDNAAVVDENGESLNNESAKQDSQEVVPSQSDAVKAAETAPKAVQ